MGETCYLDMSHELLKQLQRLFRHAMYVRAPSGALGRLPRSAAVATAGARHALRGARAAGGRARAHAAGRPRQRQRRRRRHRRAEVRGGDAVRAGSRASAHAACRAASLGFRVLPRSYMLLGMITLSPTGPGLGSRVCGLGFTHARGHKSDSGPLAGVSERTLWEHPRRTGYLGPRWGRPLPPWWAGGTAQAREPRTGGGCSSGRPLPACLRRRGRPGLMTVRQWKWGRWATLPQYLAAMATGDWWARKMQP